jgi:hypothetical protein
VRKPAGPGVPGMIPVALDIHGVIPFWSAVRRYRPGRWWPARERRARARVWTLADPEDNEIDVAPWPDAGSGRAPQTRTSRPIRRSRWTG